MGRRGMNWGRMCGQYRNRQIRLAVARSRPKYRTNVQQQSAPELDGTGITILFIFIIGIIGYILCAIACVGSGTC
jgi:hypothetical protein